MAKRVKTVYDTSEIAHLWAHGLDDRPYGVRNQRGNFFAHNHDVTKEEAKRREWGYKGAYKCATLYSYGTHFTVGKRVEVDIRVNKARQHLMYFVLNANRYSVTTAKHQSFARRAIQGLGIRTYSVPGNVLRDFDPGNWTGSKPTFTRYHEWTQGEIDSFVAKAKLPRKRKATILSLLQQAQRAAEEYRRACADFGVKPRALRCPAIDEDLAEWGRKAEAREQAARKARQAEIDRQNAERAKEEAPRLKYMREVVLPAWRAGGDDRHRFTRSDGGHEYMILRDLVRDMKGWDLHRHDFLRFEPDTKQRIVETSDGARVATSEAKAALALLGSMAKELEGKGPDAESRRPEVKVGDFTGLCLTPKALTIGCHAFSFDEIRTFATLAGWGCPPLPQLVEDEGVSRVVLV